MIEVRSAQHASYRLVAVAAVGLAVTLHFVLMGRAVLMLNVGLVAAYFVWAARDADREPDFAALLPVYLAAVAVQGLHLGEEFLTGFQRDFPGLFGYEWTDFRFLTFNLVWLAIFVIAAVGVRRRQGFALLIVWFFAIVGGIGNGIGHLVLMAAARAYFPGAVTAPACLVLGVLLIRRLVSVPSGAVKS